MNPGFFASHQFPGNVPWKAVNYGPGMGAPEPHMGDMCGVLIPGMSLALSWLLQTLGRWTTERKILFLPLTLYLLVFVIKTSKSCIKKGKAERHPEWDTLPVT